MPLPTTPLVAQIQRALAKPFMPVVFFFAGVTYDTLTLTRIDRLLDNLILLLYLSLLGFLILLVCRIELGKDDLAHLSVGKWDVASFAERARPYYPMAIQFLLGGLFSAYAIFYSQSASWTTTAVFFGVLVAFLVANEFLRDRLTSVKLLVSLYALVTFSFFTFFLPVITGIMNTVMFLVGAILSAAVTVGLVRQIYRGVAMTSRWTPVMTGLPALVLIGVLIAFYFQNWIPPVPLALKFAGAYHEVTKEKDTYHLTYERAWYQFWKRSDNPLPADRQGYFFAAVFAPVDLNTTIYHHWQYRPAGSSKERKFATSDKIPIAISGGREGGYRAYTVKQRLFAGDWRVDVETQDGRVIGRVNFTVEIPPEGSQDGEKLRTITY